MSAINYEKNGANIVLEYLDAIIQSDDQGQTVLLVAEMLDDLSGAGKSAMTARRGAAAVLVNVLELGLAKSSQFTDECVYCGVGLRPETEPTTIEIGDISAIALLCPACRKDSINDRKSAVSIIHRVLDRSEEITDSDEGMPF
jgi:hypothetical protein